MGTAIVLVLLVAAIIGIVHSLTKDRKKPGGGCSGCGGGCAGCSGCGGRSSGPMLGNCTAVTTGSCFSGSCPMGCSCAPSACGASCAAG